MGISLKQVLFNRSFRHILILLLGSISLGIAIAFPSPTLASITKSFSLSPSKASLFNAITSLTAVIGPFFANLFLISSGPRFTTLMCALLCAFSWFILYSISETAINANFAILHRAILGVAIGGFTAVNPLYIMELSPVELRSIYGSMHQFGITIGIFLTNLMGTFSVTWQNLCLFSFSVSLLLIALLYFVPESPTYTSTSMTRTPSASNGDFTNESIFNKRNFPSLFIGIMMMVFQQFSGINAVLSNLQSIVKSAAGPTFAASSQCFSCLLCMSIIEMIGRKKTWMISLFGSAFAMFILAFDSVFKFGSVIVAIAAFAFLFFFCFGLGPIPWFLMPEMFPDRLRGTASSILSSLNWMFSFTIIFIYPMMIKGIGETLTLSIFAIILTSGGFYGMKYIGNPKPISKIAEGDEIPSFADVMVEV